VKTKTTKTRAKKVAKAEKAITADEFDAGMQSAANGLEVDIIKAAERFGTSVMELVKRSNGLPEHLILASVAEMVSSLDDMEKKVTEVLERIAQSITPDGENPGPQVKA